MGSLNQDKFEFTIQPAYWNQETQEWTPNSDVTIYEPSSERKTGNSLIDFTEHALFGEAVPIIAA